MINLFIYPVIGSLLLYVFPDNKLARFTSLCISLLVLFISLEYWVIYDDSLMGYQFCESVPLISSLGISLDLGVDGISLLFLVLNCLLVPLCLLASWDGIIKDWKSYASLFLIMEGFVNLVFITTDLMVFYLGFEIVLIPMFITIGYWGSRERKIRASYFFFLYTLLGSVFFLIGILYLLHFHGTTDIQLLSFLPLSNTEECILWLAFFLSFSVKVPIVPFHIWLPEAHVEAPTAGSVFLAGILLKLGTYGLIRLSIPLFPSATTYFSPVLIMRCLVAVVYASLTAIRQTDMKRIIAYASVAHINMTLLGVFSGTIVGIGGGVFQMLAHGIVSGALFLCVGVLYDRYHSRLVYYYSGMVHFIPLYAVIFLSFTMANIAIPGTANFTGEFLIILGLINWTTVGTFFSASGLVLGGAYSRWLLNRVIYGNVKRDMEQYSDLTYVEMATLFPLFIIIIWIGLFPDVFLATLDAPSSYIVSKTS